jgi:hypothetical protein
MHTVRYGEGARSCWILRWPVQERAADGEALGLIIYVGDGTGMDGAQAGGRHGCGGDELGHHRVVPQVDHRPSRLEDRREVVAAMGTCRQKPSERSFGQASVPRKKK